MRALAACPHVSLLQANHGIRKIGSYSCSICNGCLKKVKYALDKVQSPALVWLCGLSDLGTACLCIVSPCMEAAQHTPVEIFMDSMNGVHNY